MSSREVVRFINPIQLYRRVASRAAELVIWLLYTASPPEMIGRYQEWWELLHVRESPCADICPVENRLKNPKRAVRPCMIGIGFFDIVFPVCAPARALSVKQGVTRPITSGKSQLASFPL